MLKISYPGIKEQIKMFNKRYVSQVASAKQASDLKSFWITQKLSAFSHLTLSKLLIASIETLLEQSDKLNKTISTNQQTELRKILNYDNSKYGKTYQPTIARFFMNSPELEISTCYFCNIDYINSFLPIRDYFDDLDFVKNASVDELEKISGISAPIAQKIIAIRSVISAVKDLKLSGKIMGNLSERTVKQSKNLFTLDHVLDKGKHPLAALSLYNLVPSCYNCNSKLKGTKQLIEADASLSPTSSHFRLSETVRFKLFFSKDSAGKFTDDIKTTKDFKLDFEIDHAGKPYDRYLDVFGLRSRYVFHKREALSLISKRKRYSDSQIREIARLTRMPEQQVRKDIFGEEIFEQSANIKSLTKLKRDIAKQIGLPGAL